MMKFLLHPNKNFAKALDSYNMNIFKRMLIPLLVLCLGIQMQGQQLDTWLTADRAVNTIPNPVGDIHLFTPYAPADGTPVTTWYDFVDYTPQDAVLHPANPADYPLAPPAGFSYPGGFLSPIGSVPGTPILRRDQINFNPSVEFNGNGDGEALHFRSNSRNEITVFIVFRGAGAGNTAETQRLLLGGDIDDHPNSVTNLSLGVSDGDRFSVGRTWRTDGGGFFQGGNIDLLQRPTIGMFLRDTLALSSEETLRTRVNGLEDINVTRGGTKATNRLFYYYRLGKHFNSNDSNRNYTGDIAEVLLFDGPIPEATYIQRAESYLAIKYGITLNSAGSLGSVSGNTSYDYLAADGTVIWPAGSPYIYDIAGIGKDRFDDLDGGDGTTSYDDRKLRYNLYQRISKSVNAEAIVTMSTNTDFVNDNLDNTRTAIDTGGSVFSTNHNYLLWGNDHESLASTNVELPSEMTLRISREWKVRMSQSGGVNPISGVSIKVDLSSSDILSNPACGIQLMIDTDGDGDFTTGPISYITATSVVDTDVFFDNVDFQDGDVFSIAFGDFTPPTASNPTPLTVCEVIPPPDTSVVTDEADNCAVASVTYIDDVSDNQSNPETITRIYRITDTSGNTTDVTQTITVYATPNAGGNNIVNICVGDPPIDLFANLSGTPDSGGIWNDDDGSGVDLSNPNNVDFIAVPAGMYNFTYTVSGTAPCPDDTATITINIAQPPTVANAGPDIEQCENGTFNMAANVPAVGTGTWTEVGGPVGIGIVNINDPNTTVIGLTAGSSATLRWTISNGSCTDSFDEVIITNYQNPSPADAGPDIAQCNNDLFNMAAFPPAVGIGTWTQVAGPPVVFFDINDPNTDVFGLPPALSATLRWTVTNGTCPSSFDEMVITNDFQPTADAGAGGDVCDIANAFATSAIPATGTGTWSNQTPAVGNAIFADPNDETTNINVSAYGTYTFRWTDVNGTCIDFDEITVTFHENPTIADAGPDIAQCNNGSFNMAANTPIMGTGTWTEVGGPSGITITDTSDPTTTITGLSIGNSATLRWTITNGTCPDSFDEVTITNDEQPTPANAGPDIEQCGNGTFLMAANMPSVGTGTWAQVAGALVAIDDPNSSVTAVTGLPAGQSATLRWTTVNGTCPDSFDDVTITNQQQPEIYVDLFIDPISCGADGTIELLFTNVPDGLYAIVHDNGSFANVPVASGSATVNAPAGTYDNLKITVNGCTSVEDPDVVLADPPAPDIDPIADQTVCDTYVLPGITGVNLTGNQAYYDLPGGPSGGGNIFSEGDIINSSGVYYIYDENGTCFDQEFFNVTINDTPVADAPADVEACDSYILPALANGSYFTGPGGTGTPLLAGDNITATQMVYVFSPGTGSCPDVENAFNVTINTLNITVNVENETCWESMDGSVRVDVGSTGLPLTVQLNAMQPMIVAQNSFDIDNLSPGNHVLTVLDNNGCQTEINFEVLTGGPNLSAIVEPLYLCDSGFPSNTIDVTLVDPSISSNILYALDSTNPNDFIMSPDFENISPGDHSLFILHNNGCLLEIPFIIEDIEPLNLSLASDSINEITANVSGGSAPFTYYFDGNAGNSSNTYSIDRSGTFAVRVVDGKGCEAMESITMNLIDLSIPNFFTPNNDGQNDFWKPRNMELFPDIETYIFDRYGRKIKIMGPLDKGWDGSYETKPLPSGDYWFIVKLNDNSGREYVGHFTLYR